MQLRIDIEQETDGRWLAEVEALPGVLTYYVFAFHDAPPF